MINLLNEYVDYCVGEKVGMWVTNWISGLLWQYVIPNGLIRPNVEIVPATWWAALRSGLTFPP